MKTRTGPTLPSGWLAAFLVFWALPALAQDAPGFNDAEATDELTDFAEYLQLEEVDAEFLSNARARATEIEQSAARCAAENLASRARLSERFEPLKDVDPETASPETLAQLQEVRAALDEAIARQTTCEGIVDAAQSLITAITERQNALAQQFLARRAQSFLDLLREFPQRAALWPARARAALDVDLVGGLTPGRLFWSLLAGATVAVFAGLLLGRRFASWYRAAGGDDMDPQMRYLFPKPLSEFAPLWLTGLVLLVILHLALVNPSSSLLIVRFAWAVFVFGLGSVVVNWATGPLSPSRDIKGLIPDHVDPLRRRLRIALAALSLSYVVLGNAWLSIDISQPYITGRASMILVVGASVLFILTYLGRIPGLQSRYRVQRLLAIAALVIGLVALLAGYQNLAGYVIRGITLTSIALFALWVLLWVFNFGFSYLIEQDTRTAAQIRTSLGISGKRSASGIGFMQLVADLVLWISFIVFLIYVWDNTGTTLPQLQDVISQGWTFGEMRVVPKNIVGSILIFAGLIVVVGRMKRWIDRRWLSRIVTERGARDAILTLVGYFGFVIAIVLALILADVDLTGLAIVSGALALGLGFGMQEIANNFVSGLILLFERPIRAGDFVTVGDVQGYVRSIRIRATEIETLDNQNVLVPNSQLVSGLVTNWVLRDTHGRLQVPVGVAYGSDTELVRDILERVGHEHPEVITDGRAPQPRAFFLGFGDSSLNFELRVRVQRVDSRFAVMSDLNFAIDKEFREAGITIPFPQRDLHIVSYPATKEENDAAQEAQRRKLATPRDDITRRHDAEIQTEASRDEVWHALTDLDTLKRWLVRGGKMTPQLGGEIDFELRDGRHVRGRIDVFVPERRLRIVLIPDDAETATATSPITALFTVDDINGATRLKVAIGGIPASEDWEEYYRLSVDSWESALAELRNEVLRK